MSLAQYLIIKREYGKFYDGLLRNGRLPLKDTGVGYWSMAVADDIYQLCQRLKLSKRMSFLDIGSGDGKVVHIASLFAAATGIEIDDELHEKAVEIKKKLNLNSKLIKGDYHYHDLSKYDLIFYHPDHHNHKLELKLMHELKGKLIVYGGLFQPTSLKREMSFIANTTPVSIFTRKEH